MLDLCTDLGFGRVWGQAGRQGWFGPGGALASARDLAKAAAPSFHNGKGAAPAAVNLVGRGKGPY